MTFSISPSANFLPVQLLLNRVTPTLAEFGLDAITGNHKERLRAVMSELGNDLAAMRKGPRKAIALLRVLRTHPDTDPRVAACDGTPYGARVAFRATLQPALAQAQAVLESALAA